MVGTTTFAVYDLHDCVFLHALFTVFQSLALWHDVSSYLPWFSSRGHPGPMGPMIEVHIYTRRLEKFENLKVWAEDPPGKTPTPHVDGPDLPNALFPRAGVLLGARRVRARRQRLWLQRPKMGSSAGPLGRPLVQEHLLSHPVSGAGAPGPGQGQARPSCLSIS